MLGVVRDLRSPRSLTDPADAAAHRDHLLAEFVLTRLVHGVADGTVRSEFGPLQPHNQHRRGLGVRSGGDARWITNR